MIGKLKVRIINFFSNGHPRTLLAKKNIIFSLGLKGVSILVGFILVPITLNYLDSTKYGIWLTMSSIIAWFGFFDIGLGNGLRNKLGEALALKNYTLARAYISTTYFVLTVIIGFVFTIFLIINPYLNWAEILNTPQHMADELSCIALIVFSFFSIRFVLKLIGTILTADQHPAINNSFVPIGNVISLALIYAITKLSVGSLLYISIAYSVTPVVVLLFASLILFRGKYKHISISFKALNLKYFKPLAGLGAKFFLLQISAIVIFSTDNMIITQILGPEEVTPYNIAFQYFSIPTMLFTIILSPYWSAFTEAMTLGDTKWIRNTVSKLLKFWFTLPIGILLMILISNKFYLIWVGDIVHIPVLLSVFMGIYILIFTFSSIFVNFINGVGKVKLQLYFGVFAMLINIPFSVFFAKNMGMGSAGVILGTCVSLSIGAVFGPVQYYKIINNKAKGVWNK